jgi:integrase
MLMSELFTKFEAECLAELRPRTARDYRRILDHLRVAFGHMEAKDVKPRHVADFINVPKGRVHRNRMVMILSMIYTKAQGRWCIDEDLTNPCTPVERWPTKPRTRYVTDEEFEGFRAGCCEAVQIAMDLALLTGQRQGDIIGLKWDHVHASGPRKEWHIRIQQGKTGKLLGIGISPAIEEVLLRARVMEPTAPHEYVLRTNARNKRGESFTSDGFRAMWQREMKQWVKRGNPKFVFHDIRAKAISDNKDFQNAYLLAGHINQSITRRVYDRNIRMVEPLR